MTATDRLKALLNIHPGEGTMVLLLLGLSLLEFLANAISRTVTYALFLADFNADTLPYVYIGVAASATLVSYLYLKLTERFSLGTVLLSNTFFLTMLLFGLWAGTTFSGARWVIFSLPIAFGILNTLMITAYWGLIGRVLNIQQSKRLTGLVATAETIAFMLAGFLMPLMVGWLGADNMLLVAAMLMGLALAAQLSVNRFFAEQLAAPPAPAADVGRAASQNNGQVFKSGYVRLILTLFTLFVIGVYFVDNTFYALSEIRFPEADELASFVGVFWGVSSVLVLLMQGFVSGRILVRFGVGVVMMLTPALLLVESSAMALVGTLLGLTPLLFWLGVTANLSRIVLDATDQAAVNVLYQPLPVQLRTRVQTLVNGVFYPVSIGLAGVLLLLFRNLLNFGVVQTTYVIVLITASWLAAAVLLRRAYPQALMKALGRRDVGDVDALVGDAASLAVFRRGLESPHLGVVVYSLDMLEQMAPEQMVEALPGLLAHPLLEIRLDVLRRIERVGLRSALPAIRLCFEGQTSAVVRGAALRTMAVIGEDDDELFDEIHSLLDHHDAEIRRGALVGMLRSGRLEGIVAAAGKLTESVNDADPAERAYAAEVLGEGGIRSFYRPLLQLLEDDELVVRRAALEAAGKLGNRKLWPAVIDNLASRPVRAAAMAALVSGGDSIVPAVQAQLNGQPSSRSVQLRLIRVLGRVGGESAIALLSAHSEQPDEQLRTEILLALSRSGYQATAGQRQRVEAQIRAEVAQTSWLAAALADLERHETAEPLCASLEQHLHRHRLRLLLLCSFIYDAQLIERVRQTLIPTVSANGGASQEQISYALEALDILLSADVKTMVLPVLEGVPAADLANRLRGSFPQARHGVAERLQQIIVGSGHWLTPWARALALYEIAAGPVLELIPTVEKVLTSPEPVIREAALWTLRRLDGEGHMAVTEAPFDDSSPIKPEMARRKRHGQMEDQAMLTTLERVLALKALSFFADTPDEVLADVAPLLKEERFAGGETIFEKNEVGHSLYIIVEGRVRIHDGERDLDALRGGDAFGEMSILDPAPRSA
ncbi:MAG: HEAT repeat domain-containing protein, partial [Candidatus Promineifilaceae bacterium]|nr:HEAT repeat domain-containing protein [Candidatus Promineifilaceae bacterium]